jgi:hypothetical protein
MPDLTRKLPNWIDAFLHYTENTEPPYMFRKWTAISTIAAAMQRKCFINWGTSLVFYPNLFVVLVGPSATRKGTAMAPGLDLMLDIPTIMLSAQATSLQALIKRLKNTNLSDIDLKTGLQNFHSSMTILSKEFTVFLGYHNRELMAALCDWYDCEKRWTYETISRDAEEIVGVWVNLFAATTPDSVKSALPHESIGGGLTSRIIFVCENDKGKLVTLPKTSKENEKEVELRQYLLYDLEKIALLSGEFGYTEDFARLWHNWCVEAENNPPFQNAKFDGYLGRRRTHLMKLSMIMSASCGQEDLKLTRDDLELAIDTLNEVEIKMDQVFLGVGKSDISDLIYRATAFLVNLRKPEIAVWKFARNFSDDMDRWTLQRVLQSLEITKTIKQIHIPGGDDKILVLEHRDKIVKNLNGLESSS